MRRILSILFLLVSFMADGQGYLISGKISGLPPKKIILTRLYGDKSPVIDSVSADANGNSLFHLSSSAPIGMYRLVLPQGKFLDVIFNKENIEFSTAFAEPLDSIFVSQSNETRIYCDFLKKEKSIQERIDLLTPVIDYYPKDQKFYQEAVSTYESLQKELQKEIRNIDQSYPGSFVARVIRTHMTPFMAASLGKEERIVFLKSHYLDDIDFTDTLLFRSNALTSKIISYLSLFSNPDYSQKQLEDAFSRAVSIILYYASVNPKVYDFVVAYLVGGFEKYHFDDVLTFLADNYNNPAATRDTISKSALEKRLDFFKIIAIGKKAPGFSLTDMEGNQVSLNDISANNILLLFYSSDCPHCTVAVPEIYRFCQKFDTSTLKVLAISLDTDRTTWESYVKKEKLDWINVSEVKGWNSKVADDYHIYATPTMILLDSNYTITAKPLELKDLKQVLKPN